MIDIIRLIVYTAEWERVLKERLAKGMRLDRLEVIIQGRHVFGLIGGYRGYYIGSGAGRLLVGIEIKPLLSAFIS